MRCRFSFSRFAVPDLFSAVPRATGTIFMVCVARLIFGGSQGVGSRFHILRSRTRFRRFRGRRVLFSCFALSDSFPAVSRASGLIFMFCAPGLISGGSEGVGSRLHYLRVRNRFRRVPGRRIPFSCFALPDSFSGVPRASVPFSCFALPDSFSAVPRA
jgi:hypothetical protein